MNIAEFISLHQLSEYHQTDITFFAGLEETGLIEIHRIEEVPHVNLNQISELEKMIRMHRELHINAEGIDTVFQLLKKMETLQQELYIAKSRLRLYEE